MHDLGLGGFWRFGLHPWSIASFFSVWLWSFGKFWQKFEAVISIHLLLWTTEIISLTSDFLVYLSQPDSINCKIHFGLLCNNAAALCFAGRTCRPGNMTQIIRKVTGNECKSYQDIQGKHYWTHVLRISKLCFIGLITILRSSRQNSKWWTKHNKPWQIVCHSKIDAACWHILSLPSIWALLHRLVFLLI